jgi:hypothetical protein
MRGVIITENLIRGDNETLALWTEVTKRPAGRPEKRADTSEEEILYNIQDKDSVPKAPDRN